MNLNAVFTVTRGACTVDVDVHIDAGRLVAVLGPNGAGKTTLLSALAGLLPVDRGCITLGGVVLDDPAAGLFVPPERRPVGVVFQDQLLFPHLSAVANVAFGLQARHLRRGDALAQAMEWLDRLGLAERAAARPSELSGGQAQRVALARALAPGPSLLLLDEPLAALDVQSRIDVRRALRVHLSAFPGVRLLVTHDPIDAFSLADRVIILEDGRVTHDGEPHAVTARPRTDYVAQLGGTNLFAGTARDGEVEVDGGAVLTTTANLSGDVFVVIEATAVALHRARPDGSPRNTWPMRVVHIDHLGRRARVELAGPLPLVADVTPAAVAALALHGGGEVWAAVKATEISVTPR